MMTNNIMSKQGGDHTKEEYNIIIAQINMARTAIANEDLLRYAQQESIDVALIQEPYTRYGSLVGLDVAPIRRILSPGVKQRGGHNILRGAAIVIFNPALTVLAREDLTCGNFAVATISTDTGISLNLICAYFKYRDPCSWELCMRSLRPAVTTLPSGQTSMHFQKDGTVKLLTGEEY